MYVAYDTDKITTEQRDRIADHVSLVVNSTKEIAIVAEELDDRLRNQVARQTEIISNALAKLANIIS